MKNKKVKIGRPCKYPSCSIPMRFPVDTLSALREASEVSGIPQQELIRRAVNSVYVKIENKKLIGGSK